jgi:5-methylcytosine-specific restriction endonuclease McrA
MILNQPKVGRPKKFCTAKCKDSYGYKIEKKSRPALKVKTCPTCNLSFQTSFSSRIRYCSKNCQPRMIALKTKQILHPCQICFDDTFYRRVYCDRCWMIVKTIQNSKKIIYSETNSKSRRLKRESETLGLTRWQRKKLLNNWKAELQPCSYCLNVADTIDHIIPLIKGGTHLEENLTPACRSCNGSKAGHLISEWKVLNVGSSA